MKSRLLTALCLVFSLLGFVPAQVVASDSYPSKPIKLYVGFPPGGPTDIIGRVIGRQLSKELGQQVVIVNTGGAGGIVAATTVSRADPDGYSLLVSVESSQTRAQALYGQLTYDQERSFSFLRKVAKQHSLIVVNPQFPVHSVGELIAYLKAHPGEVNVGETFGTSSHIGGTLFDMANGTKMTFVSYPGGAQPITDTVSGTLQLGFFTEATVAELVKAGSLRALAIAAPERSRAFPDLPTVTEAGSKPIDPSPWFGVVGPANMPPDVVSKLGEALDRMTASEEFLAALETLGAVPIQGSTSESFAQDVGREIVFWNQWAKDVNAPIAH
jgi:tripartite-type tricarboxylate transporter receptor subunit TctC